MPNIYFFIDHIWDIWKIAAHKDVDVGVAYDMFRTDARFGKAHEYNTDMPDLVDWTAMKAEYDALVEAELLDDAYALYHQFKTREVYFKICYFWKAEDKDALDAFVAKWKADYEAAQEKAKEEAAE